MKKVIIALLVLASLFAFVSCKDASDEVVAPEPEKELPTAKELAEKKLSGLWEAEVGDFEVVVDVKADGKATVFTSSEDAICVFDADWVYDESGNGMKTLTLTTCDNAVIGLSKKSRANKFTVAYVKDSPEKEIADESKMTALFEGFEDGDIVFEPTPFNAIPDNEAILAVLKKGTWKDVVADKAATVEFDGITVKVGTQTACCWTLAGDTIISHCYVDGKWTNIPAVKFTAASN